MSNEKRRGLISTALAVVQPLALSWVTVVILAVLSYVLAASSPMLGDAPWQDAARLGSSVWLLALGAPLGVDGGSVGLMPLAVTGCTWLLCRHFMRGAPIFDWVDVGAATATAGVTAALLSLLSSPDSFRLVGILGAMFMVAVSALASWWKHEPPEHRAWSLLGECWKMMRPILAGIVIAALAGVVVAVVLGWSTIVEINSYYVLGAVGTISLSLVQLLYLPNIVVWAMAYIGGIGFVVGSGSNFSSLSVTAAPLPALPVLGALPEPGVSFPWLLAFPILLGLVTGLWRAKNFPTLRQLAIYGLGTTGLFMLLLAVLGALASGGIGPERMAEVGVNPPLFALILTLETCGGLLLGLVLRNDQMREIVRQKINARRGIIPEDRGDSGDNAAQPMAEESVAEESVAEESVVEPGSEEPSRPDPASYSAAPNVTASKATATSPAPNWPSLSSPSSNRLSNPSSPNWPSFNSPSTNPTVVSPANPSSSNPPSAATAPYAATARSAVTSPTAYSAVTSQSAVTTPTAATSYSADTSHSAHSATTPPSASSGT
ncbi:MAG: DUF6350 family protein [Ancrocorticia sp.]